jgi:CBS-domain-containing membrane protein
MQEPSKKLSLPKLKGHTVAARDQLQRVRIYLRTGDLWEGEPLYTAVIQQLQRQGASGATVINGLAGFGPNSRIQTILSGENNDKPVIIEWIDRAERINRLLPLLDDMLPNALTTIEDIQVYRAAMRSRSPFSDESTVSDFILGDVVTLQAHAPIGPALYLMLSRNQQLLPVLDERSKVVGVITSSDLQRRLGMKLPLRILRELSPDEVRPYFERIAPTLARDCMTSDPRCINGMNAISQVVVNMLEWNYQTLPVVDSEQRFSGLLTRERVLYAALPEQSSAESTIRDADAPLRLEQIMQVSVPATRISNSTEEIINLLLSLPGRFLVLVDDEGVVQGTLSDSGVIRNVSADQRQDSLSYFANPGSIPFPISDPISSLIDKDIHSFTPNQSVSQVIQQFIERDIDRALVLHENGKLAGMVTTTALLRTLTQTS